MMKQSIGAALMLVLLAGVAHGQCVTGPKHAALGAIVVYTVQPGSDLHMQSARAYTASGDTANTPYQAKVSSGFVTAFMTPGRYYVEFVLADSDGNTSTARSGITQVTGRVGSMVATGATTRTIAVAGQCP